MRAITRCGLIVLSMVLTIGLIIPVGALAAKEIKIGVIYPLTGGAAAAGRELRAGVELAVEIANNAMSDINMTMAKNRRYPRAWMERKLNSSSRIMKATPPWVRTWPRN